MTKDEDDHARRRGGRQARVPKHGQIQNPSVHTFYCYTDLTVALTLAPSDHHSGLSLIYMARVPCRSVHHSYPPQIQRNAPCPPVTPTNKTILDGQRSPRGGVIPCDNIYYQNRAANKTSKRGRNSHCEAVARGSPTLSP